MADKISSTKPSSKLSMISWNVNGIRAARRKGFDDFLHSYSPDILCLQEVKATLDQIDEKFKGYHVIWNAAQRKGYSGTAILTKDMPFDCYNGLPGLISDTEGRVITADYGPFYLVTVYTPNSKMDLSRLGYRHKEWDIAFLEHVVNLEKVKPVIFCGDLNVARTYIDLHDPSSSMKSPGFTREERDGIENMIAAGFIDTFREFEKDKGHYTWWSYRTAARERNVGWRIDYFLISEVLRPHLTSASILSEVYGSDHCPVAIEIDTKKV